MLVERSAKYGVGLLRQDATATPTHPVFGADASAELDCMIRSTPSNRNLEQAQVPEKRALKQVVEEMNQKGLFDLSAGATHQDLLDQLEKAASFIQLHAQIEVEELALILDLLRNQDNQIMRFIASFCIHKLIRNKLNSAMVDDQSEPPLRAWLKIDNHNAEFLDLLCNTLFSDQSIPVKALLAECICDFLKLTSWSMFETLIIRSEYVQKAILILEQLVTSKIAIASDYIHMKGEINKLAYNIVWSLGMINSERAGFANIFINSGGVAVCLKLIE